MCLLVNHYMRREMETFSPIARSYFELFYKYILVWIVFSHNFEKLSADIRSFIPPSAPPPEAGADNKGEVPDIRY